jgi:hypothetical protein
MTRYMQNIAAALAAIVIATSSFAAVTTVPATQVAHAVAAPVLA